MEPTILESERAAWLHGLNVTRCGRCGARMCVCTACLRELVDPGECPTCEKGRVDFLNQSDVVH